MINEFLHPTFLLLWSIKILIFFYNFINFYFSAYNKKANLFYLILNYFRSNHSNCMSLVESDIYSYICLL
jgi:hypothetical protein